MAKCHSHSTKIAIKRAWKQEKRNLAAADKLTDTMLRFDPLQTAEKMTGESYKVSKGTEMLGLTLHTMHTRATTATLIALGDTTFSNEPERYLEIVKSEGFEVVLELPFQYVDEYDKEERADKLFVLFNRKLGALLVFDTYWNCTSVNSGHVYFNWRSNGEPCYPGYGFSGGFAEDEQTVAGNFDCREAFRFHMRQLKENGNLVTPWVEQPFLWLLHYRDTKGEHGSYDHEAINAERIAMLPEYVRKAIGA